ncbi:hypothetical protein L6164_019801 [Bauhinia variegata]|uniref:Uncharacterized protein n=1 Tax=Bauhinia variegata TaxID=167791 RepID=A0ACB9MSZ0_BAUVA|nr:hypothetical protein L6164_019801 [Bauhinia variegata]
MELAISIVIVEGLLCSMASLYLPLWILEASNFPLTVVGILLLHKHVENGEPFGLQILFNMYNGNKHLLFHLFLFTAYANSSDCDTDLIISLTWNYKLFERGNREMAQKGEETPKDVERWQVQLSLDVLNS